MMDKDLLRRDDPAVMVKNAGSDFREDGRISGGQRNVL